MSLQHFFLKKQILSDEIEKFGNQTFFLDLSKDDLHHLNVLRLKPGEHIGVIDASGVFYECEIVDVKDKVMVKNSKKENSRKQQEYPKIALYAGLTKSNKLDEVLRAATEIGIEAFVASIFDRSVVKLDEKKASTKIDRWKKIARSAAMQSGQLEIPKVMYNQDFETTCRGLMDFDYVLCFWEEADENLNVNNLERLKTTISNDSKIAVIVGPEGGITKEEISKIMKSNKNVTIAGMGDSILRAETACIFAVSILKFCLSC